MSQTLRSMAELFRQYLHRQISAQADGLGIADPDGQALPYEAGLMQPLDPQLAWEDALTVMRFIRAGSPSEGTNLSSPVDWPSLVAVQEPAISLAFCVGNFPQIVRHWQPLLTCGDPIALRSKMEGEGVRRGPAVVPSALMQWASLEHDYPLVFVAAGVLRLACRFDEAGELLRARREVPAAWRALRANEEAALAWHRGNAEEALTSWQSQKASVPVLFNRGMASLFLGRLCEAQTALGQAVVHLPETSAWHHLGHLYLALIATRC